MGTLTMNQMLRAVTVEAKDDRDLLAAVIRETEERTGKPAPRADDYLYEQMRYEQMREPKRPGMCYCGDPSCPGEPELRRRADFAMWGPFSPVDWK